ncbi:MAG: copper resistance protein CopC [Methylococcaceae bacterium]|nr:copper resistance protein CopC [Methylococcaceae bacterium]
MNSFKRFVCSLPFLFSCYAGQLNAHAVVTEHSLSVGVVNAHQTSQVKLNFNSSVEVGLSQIFLVRTGDIEEALPLKAGKTAGVVLVDMPALDAGKYALHYRIFAADGHLTDDIIHFTVQP